MLIWAEESPQKLLQTSSLLCALRKEAALIEWQPVAGIHYQASRQALRVPSTFLPLGTSKTALLLPMICFLLQDSPKKAASCLQLFEDARGLPPEQAILVRSLLCRAAYGGMTGDIELLKGNLKQRAPFCIHVSASVPHKSRVC